MKDRPVNVNQKRLFSGLTVIIAVIALSYATSKPKLQENAESAEALVERTSSETEDNQSSAISNEGEMSAITLPQNTLEQRQQGEEQMASTQTTSYEAQMMNQTNDVYSGDTQTYYIVARALSDPGISKVAKRAFAIPEGWTFLNAEKVYEKGLSRVIVDDDYVYVEAHALSTNKNLHEEAVAKVKIVIAKI